MTQDRLVDVKGSVQQSFGSVAANYVTSAVHARGADLTAAMLDQAQRQVERMNSPPAETEQLRALMRDATPGCRAAFEVTPTHFALHAALIRATKQTPSS